MNDSKKVIHVAVPGSKSITNRALLLAALSEGTSVLRGCMFSDDSKYFIECIRTLGFSVDIRSNTGDKQSSDYNIIGSDIIENNIVEITGFGGEIPEKKAELYVGSAGTAARFLCAMLAFSDGEYLLNSSDQMKKRPMGDLLKTLRSAGAEIVCLEEEGHFPMKIRGTGANNIAELTVDVTKSSQFLSALMIAAGTFGKDTIIRLEGSHGLAYADMTAEMMRSFGIRVFKSTAKSSFGDKVVEKISYKVKAAGKKYLAQEYDVEPDLSAAAYFYALAALTGAEIEVEGVKRPSLQGDIQFVDVLEAMGCEVNAQPVVCDPSSASLRQTPCPRRTGTETLRDSINPQGEGFMGASSRAERIVSEIFKSPEEEPVGFTVKGPDNMQGAENGHKGLKGNITVDMSAFSDQALTLAALAPFSDGPIKITGISHIRGQECDRISAITENLGRLGIKTEVEEDDSIIIYPGEMHGAELETYDDHRVAMSFALTGVKVPGVKILNPECCKKTFKEYFEVLDKVIQEISR